MPLTTLDRDAALVVIDLQKGIVGTMDAEAAHEIVGRAAALARAFRERGLVVVLVNVTGAAPGRTDVARPNFRPAPDWAELVPQLEAQSSDLRISKQRWGAFVGTGMDAMLRERGVTQVFLAGASTSVGVESTARSLYDAGYHVVFVADAMVYRDPQAHALRIEKLFPRMGEVDTAAGVLKVLCG